MNRLRFLAAGTLLAGSACGQVIDLVVGITPNCPYGFVACWPSAEEGLRHLDGVQLEEGAIQPDYLTCTARLKLKHQKLPDITAWKQQFSAIVGQAHLFRGVEITVQGTLIRTNEGKLQLHFPGTVLDLVPLSEPLQFDPKTRKSFAATKEAGEKFSQLQAAAKEMEAKPARHFALSLKVTGPFKVVDGKPCIEVHSFHLGNEDEGRSKP